MNSIAFLFLALITLSSALYVVFAKNPVYSVLSLIVCFFSITGHYALMNANFLAIVNLIVYAGAIMVLFLFVIMMLNLNRETEPHKSFKLKLAAVLSSCLLMLGLIIAIKGYSLDPQVSVLPENFGNAKSIGKLLYSDYVLPFEVASILFISAMVGAVILAKKHVND
jgi:NADH-quinone oxidoreductase subunit J